MAKKAVSMKYQAKAQKGKTRKERIVAEISEYVNKAKGMVFTNYQGLTHLQLESIKRAVKKLEADYVATKNTLLKIALSQSQNAKVKSQNEDNEDLNQPTATLFIYGDPIEPIKILAKTIKELKLPLIKFGILDGKTITSKQVEQLATLPALPLLRAQLVGTLNSPIQNLHRALNWNLVRLAMTLKAIEQNKS